MDEEIKKIIDEMENNSVQNNQTEPLNQPQEEPQKEEVQEKKVDENVEEKVEKTTEEEPQQEEYQEDIKQRKPREPKMIPAWKAEVEKKKTIKSLEEKFIQEKQELLNELNSIRSEFEQIKKNSSISDQQKIDDRIKEIEELSKKYDVDYNFLADIYKILKPKEVVPTELLEKIAEIDKLKEEQRIKQEDLIFEDEFSKFILPNLKQKYQDITDSEVSKIKEAIKKDYFSEKYITLNIDEIYKLKQDSYEKFIAPRKYSFEKSSKSRIGESINYENITEEEFIKLPPDEQEKVINFLAGRKK
ncbi:MAG: hypothetical protein N2Z85_02055 [Patescibacteria group bacterium]|nr:hypothetical protein [Patescibacteria group bacterium]